jgi:RimJ/RimL family protein N-acetyltransferase
MASEIKAIVLEAPGVRLEPLAEQHREGLRIAAQAPAIWAHMPTPALGERFDAWFDGSMQACEGLSETGWAVRTLDDGRLVGSTRYLNIEAAHKRVEIGHTWYNPAVWAGQVNPACKYALLRFGFEALDLNRIELKTDINNTRSQAAIARLGAVREGVFRAHMIRPDGSLRDTVYFSILRQEWPAVRDGLLARLAAFQPLVSKETA